jgi:hypothetical protein
MGDGSYGHDGKLDGLKALMHGKYGDVILLCSVMLAFLAMLAISAVG